MSSSNNNTPASRSVPLTCSGHTRPVVHLEFSDLLEPDGTYLLLSSCKDGNPMLRDWLGDWVGTFLGHKGAVWSAKLSGGEGGCSRAVTGSADFSAKVWDTFSGECLHTFPHDHIVRAVGVDREGGRCLTGGHEKRLRLFDLNRPEAEPVEFGTGRGEGSSKAHDGVIKSIVWPRAGPAASSQDLIVSMGEDKVVRWWDSRAPRSAVRERSGFGDGGPITSMERSYVPALAAGSSAHGSASGEMLTICSGKSITFLDAMDPEGWQRDVTLQQAVSSASLHPTQADRFVAGSTADGWVRIYDFPAGTASATNGDDSNGAAAGLGTPLQERELHKGHHGPAHIVSYSPDGELAASGSEDGTIRLWQTYPGKKYGLWV
ncbi:WD40 repeat-like protein [Jaminaea rosea]|uniref:Serine-threonine kinase receptor-associated protein n=1 Tax=Jaminaea rosea TaxID=1569628 RepID=A0A316UY83_9BASI|nr:WD40 repeat-like protein [Jaminaea rosea]PWN30172.1 WD40 repeat-like protein [Jaminaea rosea]